jgi:hypothetical protein
MKVIERYLNALLFSDGHETRLAGDGACRSGRRLRGCAQATPRRLKTGVPRGLGAMRGYFNYFTRYSCTQHQQVPARAVLGAHRGWVPSPQQGAVVLLGQGRKRQMSKDDGPPDGLFHHPSHLDRSFEGSLVAETHGSGACASLAAWRASCKLAPPPAQRCAHHAVLAVCCDHPSHDARHLDFPRGLQTARQQSRRVAQHARVACEICLRPCAQKQAAPRPRQEARHIAPYFIAHLRSHLAHSARTAWKRGRHAPKHQPSWTT